MKIQKNVVTVALAVILSFAAVYTLWQVIARLPEKNQPVSQQPVNGDPVAPPPASPSPSPTPSPAVENVTVMADDLSIPWDLAFLPDGTVLITERAGNLLHINLSSKERKAIPVQGVEHKGEGGLLGIVLHPQFNQNRWLYLYITSRSNNKLVNRVERYRWNENSQLTDKKIILEHIPGADYHDGGRIAFGPDGYLYIAVGDAGIEKNAQDINSLSGKILRLRDDGSIPSDNPFKSPVYSYGHRNPQGLAWDNQKRLWSTEHGRSGLLSGLDEVNLIVPGKNYGWPDSQGGTVLPGTVGPAAHSGANVTWAPASALYWDGSIFFGGLRGQALYEAVLSGDKVSEVKVHYKGEFGRLRTVRLGPDGMFYLTTSNRDSLGSPRFGADKIIRLNPSQFR